MEDVIHSQALTRNFGRAVAVDHLDLLVPPGTITAFLGPNGAGKTTTIRMLLGLLRPHQGSCRVLGRPPGHPEALARIGALVEQPSLYDHLTGRENLEITRLMKHAPRQEVDRVLQLVGLVPVASRPVRTYSLGMRQRLGVALALVGEPRLLILDEPNNGLDPEGILEMRELIRSLARESSVTVFLSSHLLAEVEQVASHAVVIHRGRLRFQGLMEDMGAPESEEIQIRLDDAERGTQALGVRGFQSSVENGLVRVQAPRDRVPEVVEVLVGGGFSVYEVVPRKPNLEARFMKLVEAP